MNWGIGHLAVMIIFLVTEALSTSYDDSFSSRTQWWKQAKWDECGGMNHILWYWIHVVIYVKDLRVLEGC
jgi:hypothetical protein